MPNVYGETQVDALDNHPLFNAYPEVHFANLPIVVIVVCVSNSYGHREERSSSRKLRASHGCVFLSTMLDISRHSRVINAIFCCIFIVIA